MGCSFQTLGVCPYEEDYQEYSQALAKDPSYKFLDHFCADIWPAA